MVTIGFNTIGYSVLEDAGSVNVTVSVLNGNLARNVAVTMSTRHDSEPEFCMLTVRPSP